MNAYQNKKYFQFPTTNRMIFTETKILVHFYKKIPGHYHPFPWLSWLSMTLAVFHDFPGLENGLTKFHDFPWLPRKSGHPGTVIKCRRKILTSIILTQLMFPTFSQWQRILPMLITELVNFWSDIIMRIIYFCHVLFYQGSQQEKINFRTKFF